MNPIVLNGKRNTHRPRPEEPCAARRLEGWPQRPDSRPSFETRARKGALLRLYVPSREEATHPRCACEGYPDRPGRASSKEGESWSILAKLSSVSIHRSCVIP